MWWQKPILRIRNETVVWGYGDQVDLSLVWKALAERKGATWPNGLQATLIPPMVTWVSSVGSPVILPQACGWEQCCKFDCYEVTWSSMGNKSQLGTVRGTGEIRKVCQDLKRRKKKNIFKLVNSRLHFQPTGFVYMWEGHSYSPNKLAYFTGKLR